VSQRCLLGSGWWPVASAQASCVITTAQQSETPEISSPILIAQLRPALQSNGRPLPGRLRWGEGSSAVRREGIAVRKRTVRWLLAAGLVVPVAAGVYEAWPRPDRITQANEERIRIGMSRAEVLAILGPPGDYTTAPTWSDDGEKWVRPIFDPASGTHWLPRVDGHQFKPLPVAGSKEETWKGDTGKIGVMFDASGRVWEHWYYPDKRMELGLYESLRWRARREWRRWFPEKGPKPRWDLGQSAASPEVRSTGTEKYPC
jgi:hypothetical protein